MTEDKFKTLKATLLGDGYLCPKKIGKVDTFRFGLEHSMKQFDYLQFKAQKINQEMNRSCKVHQRKTRNMASYEVVNKKEFKFLRKNFYPNNKKCLKRILDDINYPLYTLAIWLGDDAGVHWDTRKERKSKGPRIILCACDQSMKQHKEIVSWFNKIFGFSPKIKTQNSKSREKSWNIIRFSTKESLMIWYMVRKFLISIPSMAYKFRVLEEELQNQFEDIEYNLTTSVRLQQLMLDENVCRPVWQHTEIENKKSL